MFTDSHCHLDPDVYGGEAGVDAAVARAIEAGVRRMVTIGSGYDLPCMARACAVAERHHEVWFTVGVHPHDAKHWSDDVQDAIVRFASHGKCLAIGEMGLDFHYDNSPRSEQREAFRAQIRLAMALRKPIIVHDRDSAGEAYAMLIEERAFPVHGGPGVLFHCFVGDVPAMEEITAHGGYVSIPGIVTFNSAGVMREVAKAAPLDKLMIETDSPFLTPVPFRGRKNEPAHVALVGQKVAALREIPVEVLAEATSANAARFFAIPDAGPFSAAAVAGA